MPFYILNLKYCFKRRRWQFLGRVLMNRKLMNLCKFEWRRRSIIDFSEQFLGTYHLTMALENWFHLCGEGCDCREGASEPKSQQTSFGIHHHELEVFPSLEWMGYKFQPVRYEHLGPGGLPDPFSSKMPWLYPCSITRFSRSGRWD